MKPLGLFRFYLILYFIVVWIYNQTSKRKLEQTDHERVLLREGREGVRDEVNKRVSG